MLSYRIILPGIIRRIIRCYSVKRAGSVKKRDGNNRSRNQRGVVEKRIKYLLYYSSLRRKAVHLGAISKKSRRGWRRGNVRLITNSVENPPFSPSVFLLERPRFLRFPALVSILPSFLRSFSGSSLTITSWLLFSSHHRRYYLFLFYVVSARSPPILHQSTKETS